MRITPYDRSKINTRIYKKTNNMLILDEFANSEYDCVKVEGWKQERADVCTTSLNTTIKRTKMTGIKAITRKGEVFLIKIIGDEQNDN